MSCAYYHATQRIAAITGIPRNHIGAAMDVARQRMGTIAEPAPDNLPVIAALLGLPETCGDPAPVIRRVWTTLLVLIHTHSTDPRRRRWLAVANILGMPASLLTEPAHPAVVETVRRQWTTEPPTTDTLTVTGLRALRHGTPIPEQIITEAIGAANRRAIVTWIAHGAWDERFETMIADLSVGEIGTLVRAGVLPQTLVDQVVTWWPSDHLPWEAFPLDLWDRVPNPDIARKGRARTAATQLIHYPKWCTDDRLIEAAAHVPWYAGEVLVRRHDIHDDRLIEAVTDVPWCAGEVLVRRHDIHDDRLIEAAARNEWVAGQILIDRPDLRTDDRLIEAAARDAERSAVVLTQCPDFCDDRLIDAIAQKPRRAAEVLIKRQNLRNDQLITAIATAENATYARDVLLARHDLRTNEHLLAAIARDQALVDSVLAQYPDLRDHPILTAVHHADKSSG